MSGTLRLAAVLLVFLAVTAGGLIAIEAFRRDRTSELSARHRTHLAARESAWGNDEVERRQTDQREDQERLVRQHEEMVLAFGGPVAAASKNPQVDIAGMLNDVCQQCTGVAGASRVSIDRFTEFSLSIDAGRLGADQSLEEVILCVLRHCAFYVHQIEIHRRGLVVMVLDRRAIELTHDWSRASVDAVRAGIEDMRKDGGNAGSPTVLSKFKPDEEEGNLTDRTSRWKKALAKLEEAAGDSIDSMNQAVRLQRQALLVQHAGTPETFASARRNLADSQGLLKGAREFYSGLASQYRRMLVEAGVDRLYLDAELRSFEKDGERFKAKLVLEMIEHAELRGALTERLVQFLEDNRADWNPVASAGRISFESARTAELFAALSGQLEERSVLLDKTIKRLNRSNAKAY